MNQVYLFTGQDTVGLEESLSQWKYQFQKKYGDAQLYEFDLEDEECDCRELFPVLAQNSLFAEKQLVVIKGYPFSGSAKKRFNEEEEELLFQTLRKVNEHTIIAFVSPQPDKRRKKTSQLMEIATLKEFPWDAWVREDRIKKRLSGRIQSKEWNDFLAILPEDSMSLQRELEKLDACFGETQIMFDQAKYILNESTEIAAFRIFDAVAEGKMQETYRIVQTLFARGEDPHKLLGLLVWHADLLYWVYHAKKNGITKSDLAQMLEVKPFSLENPWKWTSLWKGKDIREMVKVLYQMDNGLKSGQYSKELESPQALSELFFQTLMYVQPSQHRVVDVHYSDQP